MVCSRVRGQLAGKRPGARGLMVPECRDGQWVTNIEFVTMGNVGTMREPLRRYANPAVVIVDDLLFKRSYLDDYIQVLDSANTWFIGVRCIGVVEAREAQRPGRFRNRNIPFRTNPPTWFAL